MVSEEKKQESGACKVVVGFPGGAIERTMMRASNQRSVRRMEVLGNVLSPWREETPMGDPHGTWAFHPAGVGHETKRSRGLHGRLQLQHGCVQTRRERQDDAASKPLGIGAGERKRHGLMRIEANVLRVDAWMTVADGRGTGQLMRTVKRDTP